MNDLNNNADYFNEAAYIILTQIRKKRITREARDRRDDSVGSVVDKLKEALGEMDPGKEAK